MLKGFFDTSEVDKFADWLIVEFRQELPPAKGGALKNVSDRTNKLDQVIANRTRDLIKTTKMNVYKKARLASRVREGLSALGYPDALVKSITYNLITRFQALKR